MAISGIKKGDQLFAAHDERNHARGDAGEVAQNLIQTRRHKGHRTAITTASASFSMLFSACHLCICSVVRH